MATKSRKKINQRLHAKKRARQRYGFEFTTKDLKEICGLIQDPKHLHAIKLSQKTNRVSLYKVQFRGVEMPVAYDNKSKTVASILPLSVMKKYEGGGN